jgi:hypothetical protein
MSVKDGKLGEIEVSDNHILLLLSKDDKPYIKDRYIDKLVFYNKMIDELFDEVLIQKKEIDKMVFYRNGNKMIRSYGYKTAGTAAKVYNSFMRMVEDWEIMLKERAVIMEDFHKNALRYYNDQTIHDDKFSPIDAAQVDDLITSPGINQVAKQITSETFKKWEFYELGRSLIAADFSNDSLRDPIQRFYIKSHGNFSAIGDVIRLLVISPDDMPTDDIGEVGVFNAAAGPDILFRAVLEKLVHHDSENHFLCSSSNVYLTSRR